MELLCAHTFVLVDLQAIAAKTHVVRCLSGTNIKCSALLNIHEWSNMSLLKTLHEEYMKKR